MRDKNKSEIMDKIEIKKLQDSLVEITGEMPAGDFEVYRKEALAEMGKGVVIDGFRPGMAPEKILVQKFGKGAVLEKMAELAIREIYPRILEEYKIAAIGRPEIIITKIASGNPLGFKIKTAVIPEIQLPDYKKIAETINKTKEEICVEDKEVEETIRYIIRARTQKGEEKKAEAARLTDEFVKTLGQFKDVEDFKGKIRENIKKEKEAKVKEKKRMEILEKIAEELSIEIPQVLIEAEKNKILAENKSNLEQTGLKWEDYLRQINKTEEDLGEGWNEDAVKRVKFALVLDKIAEEEKIEVPAKEVEGEAKKLCQYYQGKGFKVDESRIKMYIYNILRNEKIFNKLESC